MAKIKKSYFDKVFMNDAPICSEGKRMGRVYEHHRYPLDDKNGGFSKLSILGIESTKKKSREEILRKKEQRFRELFDNQPNGCQEYNRGRRIIEVNKTELHILGYTKEKR